MWFAKAAAVNVARPFAEELVLSVAARPLASAVAAPEPRDQSAVYGLEPTAVAATRAAALACLAWVGRGEPKAADAAATEAMRSVLREAPAVGAVVVGEGAKDEAPMLYDGERLGRGGWGFDIAVDPLECTTLCASGLPGSLATIAFAERHSMAALGASFYMEKLVAPPAAADAIDITRTPEENLGAVADALGKPVKDLFVVVLAKPRHEHLIERLQRAGSRVTCPSDGDVAGSLAALLPDGGADLLMGIGGTPEGVLTACAARALGGGMQARLAPQLATEAEAVAAAGLDTALVYGASDLVGGEGLFAATGVTGGPLVRAPWLVGEETCTETIVIAAGSVRRVIEAGGDR